MHSVERSSEPEFFDELREEYIHWDELDGSHRQRIRDALVQDFGTICAYCERPCQGATVTHERHGEETIDHFRPRNRFPDLWLEWLNLVYSCRRCNQAKGGSWPGFDDVLVNQILAGEDARYMSVSEYVHPNATDGRRPARDFFAFDAETGEIRPSAQLDSPDWSIARRTIRDIDLNDSTLGENDESHLWNRRLRQRTLLIERINGLDDFDARVNIMLEFMLPDKPFSSFIRAYVNHRFPLFRQIFQ